MKTIISRTFIPGLAATGFLAMGLSLHANVLLTSFEDAGDLFPASAGMGNIEQAPLHVTDGAFSMKADIISDSWAWSGRTYGGSTYADWYNHTKLSLDLTRVTSPNNGANLEFWLGMNGAQGWNQLQLVNWVWLNADVTQSTTLTWDYTAIRDAAPSESTWWQLHIMARSGQLGQTVYIDNIRFVDPIPEPGVASLLALGFGLLALRRRTHHSR